MARVCVVCNKKTATGNTISHSHRKTRRTWLPNLQRVRVVWDGKPQRVLVCAKCLKAGKVRRAI